MNNASKSPEGPTLNSTYNALLIRWAANGCDVSEHCESCGCDLTGKDIHETRTGWFGNCCIEAEVNADIYPAHYRERFGQE